MVHLERVKELNNESLERNEVDLAVATFESTLNLKAFSIIVLNARKITSDFKVIAKNWLCLNSRSMAIKGYNNFWFCEFTTIAKFTILHLSFLFNILNVL